MFQLHRVAKGQYDTRTSDARYSVTRIGSQWFAAVVPTDGEGVVLGSFDLYSDAADECESDAFNRQQARQDAVIESDEQHWLCDPACLYATGPICDCKCEGVNHQLGYLVTIA